MKNPRGTKGEALVTQGMWGIYGMAAQFWQCLGRWSSPAGLAVSREEVRRTGCGSVSRDDGMRCHGHLSKMVACKAMAVSRATPKTREENFPAPFYLRLPRSQTDAAKARRDLAADAHGC